MLEKSWDLVFHVKITAKAKKELKEISKIEQEALLSIFDELKEEPFYGKALREKFSKRFSMRVGVYRIIYTVNKKDKIVLILSAGHRSSVYR